MNELNNRQIDLLNYLKNHTDKYVNKKQICKDLPYAYPRHLENNNNEGNKSVAYSNISQDIRVLNDKLENWIIISKRNLGYKLATNEGEASEYIQNKFREHLKGLKLAHKLARKVKLNHQLFFSENDIEEFKTYIDEEGDYNSKQKNVQ